MEIPMEMPAGVDMPPLGVPMGVPMESPGVPVGMPPVGVPGGEPMEMPVGAAQLGGMPAFDPQMAAQFGGVPTYDPQMAAQFGGVPTIDPQMAAQFGLDANFQGAQDGIPMQYGAMPPSYEQPLDMQFASPELQPTPEQPFGIGVEDIGLKPLSVGQIVCAQASTGQWWDAEVFFDNRDFTYFLLVRDDVHTQWPRVHFADIIDRSCADFYQGELDREGMGQQEQQQQQYFQQEPELQQIPELQHQELQQQQEHVLQEQQHEEPSAETGRFPVGKKKKVPWGVVSAAAVAGSVPILYHLSGAAGPAA